MLSKLDRFSRSSKVAISIFSVLAILLIAESLARIVYVVGQFNPATSNEFSFKSKIAEMPMRKPILAYMGSSYTASSVYPEFESAALNRQGIQCSVINLAMLGNGAAPEVQMQLLQRAVASGNKPAIVFFDVSPLGGFVMARQATRRTPAQSFCYLFEYRDRLARLLREIPAIVSSPQSVAASGFGAHEVAISNQGWTPKYEAANDDLITKSLTSRRLLTNSTCKPEFFDGLKPIKDYCHQNDIGLVLVWYPTTSEVDRMFAEVGISPQDFAAQCQQITTNWQASFLNLHGELDPVYFADCDHLNAAGGYEVTKKMVKMIGASKRFQDALKTGSK